MDGLTLQAAWLPWSCCFFDVKYIVKLSNNTYTGHTASVHMLVVMGVTLAQIFYKPEKNLEFFRLKICARDDSPGKLE